MIDVSNWMNTFLSALRDVFGDRVWFVGLQGSYGRGEATKDSDIDVVVILDQLTANDIASYDRMLGTLTHRELICGFLSGKEELLNWEPFDLFQLYYDTTPIQGSMDELLPLLDTEAVARAIKVGACNIYHGCVHNMLHGKKENTLCGLYKFASFVVQAIAFQQTGRYIRHQKDIRSIVAPEERQIVDTFITLKNGGAVEFESMSKTLFTWCQNWIRN